MNETEWLSREDGREMVAFLQDKGSARKRRLFVVACARAIWERIPVGVMRGLVETSERLADGAAKFEEFCSAVNAVYAYSDKHATPEQRVWASGIGEKYSIYCHCLMAALGDKELKSLNKRYAWDYSRQLTASLHPILLRDIFGNPFRPVTCPLEWRTSTAISLASQMYEARDFSAMPILADALQDAGCDNADILDHCRGPGPHVRGCWVVDLILGKD